MESTRMYKVVQQITDQLHGISICTNVRLSHVQHQYKRRTYKRRTVHTLDMYTRRSGINVRPVQTLSSVQTSVHLQGKTRTLRTEIN